MNYPTGMGASTGHHYHNVAAQMQAYMHSPRQNHYPFQGQFIGAPQALQFGAQRMGVNPMIVNEFGGLARNFMRNLLT